MRTDQGESHGASMSGAGWRYLDPVTKTLMRCLAVVTVAVALPARVRRCRERRRTRGLERPRPVSPLHALLVFVGIPLLLIVLLALAVYLPSVVRGESLAPAGARAEDQWFGGRRDADKALSAGLRPPGRGRAGHSRGAGGASGGW